MTATIIAVNVRTFCAAWCVWTLLQRAKRHLISAKKALDKIEALKEEAEALVEEAKHYRNAARAGKPVVS